MLELSVMTPYRLDKDLKNDDADLKRKVKNWDDIYSAL